MVVIPSEEKEKWYTKVGEWWFWIVVILIGVGAFSYRHYEDHKTVASNCANPQIKGNISLTTGEKIYHVPGDPYYDKTVIDPGQGEKMFCTTQEAEAAGWRASGD